MVRPFACRNCRRPLHWSEATGWLHGELPQYAHEPITCERALPSCMYSNCDHTVSGPDDECPCNCHVSGAGPPPMDCAKHKGHRRFVGGSEDGRVDHLIHAAPSDFWASYGTMLHNRTRSWYEIDHEASKGKEVVYRFVGLGRDVAEARSRGSHG